MWQDLSSKVYDDELDSISMALLVPRRRAERQRCHRYRLPQTTSFS
jgi:hypothetical protein